MRMYGTDVAPAGCDTRRVWLLSDLSTPDLRCGKLGIRAWSTSRDTMHFRERLLATTLCDELSDFQKSRCDRTMIETFIEGTLYWDVGLWRRLEYLRHSHFVRFRDIGCLREIDRIRRLGGGSCWC